jgi:hypothetical protein
LLYLWKWSDTHNYTIKLQGHSSFRFPTDHKSLVFSWKETAPLTFVSMSWSIQPYMMTSLCNYETMQIRSTAITKDIPFVSNHLGTWMLYQVRSKIRSVYMTCFNISYRCCHIRCLFYILLKMDQHKYHWTTSIRFHYLFREGHFQIEQIIEFLWHWFEFASQSIDSTFLARIPFQFMILQNMPISKKHFHDNYSFNWELFTAIKSMVSRFVNVLE